MYVSFDKFGLLERPSIILCNPDGTQLYSLGNSYNTKLSSKYNALSTYSFDLIQTIQDASGNNIVDPAYILLKAKRLVYISNIGYFQIGTVTEDRDGKFPIKKVECVSWEAELINKQVNSFTGTSIKLYDPIDNSDTFIGLILDGTSWSVGTVTSDLWNIYRDFDVSSNNVYNVIMTTAETAYNCIFTFDPFTRLVNITSIDLATTDTDIFLSFDNLVKSTSLKEISDEIVTSMQVFGGDDLDIRSVNPLGTNNIYNFGYYQSRDENGDLLWMSEDLDAAINAWQAKILANMTTYSLLLTYLENNNGFLNTYQSDLTELESQLAALTEVKKVKIDGGLSLTDINAQIDAQNALIDSKNAQITSVNLTLASINRQILVINNNLSLTNIDNFTLLQQAELKPLIIENVYQNQNIIITDIMTNNEKHAQATELYNQAQDVLSRNAYPRYEFTVDSANFLALQMFQSFTDELELGSNVTVENQEGQFINMSVLEINQSFDILTDFSLVFSNRLRLDNGSFVNSDLFGQVVKGATTVAFNSGSWNGYTNNKNEILMTTSILNATNNQIISSTNQEISLSQAGLIGKKKLANGSYSGNQVWLTSSTLAFSSDSFQTSGLAIGVLQLPGGGTGFGVCAPAIIGELLAGSQLRIRNAANNFILDAGGARLTDASFTITSSSSHPQSIVISPTQGILIKNRAQEAVFFADGNGNLNLTGTVYANAGSFKGNIAAGSGNIGSLIIDSQGLSDTSGNYMRANSLKWGALSIDGSNAVFNGTISANKISGQINGGNQISPNSITASRIHDLNADSINAGVIRGIDVYGSRIGWGGTYTNPGVLMYGINNDFRVDAINTIYMDVKPDLVNQEWGGATITVGKNDIYMAARSKDNTTNTSVVQLLDKTVFINGDLLYMPTIGRIQVAGGTGKDGVYSLQVNGIGYMNFTFSRGILVSVT